MEMQGPTTNRMVQAKVNGLLRRGMVFSILWLMGIGSVIAVVSALKANRLIVESGGAVTGMGKVWWCLIVGGLGIMIWGVVFLVGVSNKLSGL